MTNPIVIRFATPRNRPVFRPSEKRGLFLSIASPTPPGPTAVAPTFQALGSLDTGDTIQSASLQNNAGGAPIIGVAIAPPPPYAWGFQFTTVPTGTYTLTAIAVNGGAAVLKTCLVTVP